MTNYFECWMGVAGTLFAQTLAGAPTFTETVPKPLGNVFGYQCILSGEEEGRFTVLLEETVLQVPLLGEGTDQKAGWSELLREVAEAAAGDMRPKAGRTCTVSEWKAVAGASQISSAFELKSSAGSWTILVRDETKPRKQDSQAEIAPQPPVPFVSPGSGAPAASSEPGFELLLDVELEAALRFGCRELPLGEILDLGAGDVVELDRDVADPVDLLVGDRIVARGEVVLVNGNFGLRVTEVAAPRKRLETVRCLF
jgi:flagellar motor switch protein FliN